MVLENRRLLISELTLEDAPFLYKLMNDKDWLRFIGNKNINTVKDAENYLAEKLIPNYEKSEFGFYKVADKMTDETFGIVGFVDREELEYADVGFAFLPEGRKKGYALESLQAFLYYGSEKLELDTVLAIANNNNEDSHRLLKKLGFRFKSYIKLSGEKEEISLFTNR